MFRITAIAAFILLAAQLSPAGAGEVYKCTGADGKVRYSGQPCPESTQSETLQVPKAAAPAESAGEAKEQKSLDERIAEATDPVVKAQLQLQKQRCELARTQLQRYEDAAYLVQKREDGTERRLTEEETQAERDRLRRKIEERCQ
ncbi:MAG TPA: DUF4124 domain-containing protein [Gammaproteobacteria bacterium]